MKNTKVFCIIVTYNAEPWIEKCLSTLVEDHLDLKIIVVDNASKDNTLAIIRSQFPEVEVVESKENLGFGKANNLGYKMAVERDADYVYLLNQDTISYPNNIGKLLNIWQKTTEPIAILSPMHLNEKGDKLDSKFEQYLAPKQCPDIVSDLSLSKVKDYYIVDFVNAAAWLVDVKAVKNIGGLFSKVFYHYGEDRNFIQRLQYFGYKVAVAPSVFIHHCRDERAGKFSKKFEQKRLEIRARVLMHDINNSYKQCLIEVWKEAFMEYLKLNIVSGFRLIFYPAINGFSIIKIREDLKRKIVD
ncbi:glycosyltransferase family 2 protein [Weeksellaceae bacterium TAE3-ERU29]|nr:glycosyltransferase family 2 protein [Weeksellaceae bacterium TAE3-ERU29]